MGFTVYRVWKKTNSANGFTVSTEPSRVECRKKDVILVTMERWTKTHRNFVTEVYFKSVDSVVAMQLHTVTSQIP